MAEISRTDNRFLWIQVTINVHPCFLHQSKQFGIISCPANVPNISTFKSENESFKNRKLKKKKKKWKRLLLQKLSECERSSVVFHFKQVQHSILINNRQFSNVTTTNETQNEMSGLMKLCDSNHYVELLFRVIFAGMKPNWIFPT